jgi:hypothetical protein
MKGPAVAALVLGALLLPIAEMNRLAAQASPPSPPALPTPVPALREISPGIYDYHGIQLDKKNHRITFPGTVNQRQGIIEYVLVNEKGKTHESLLSTLVQPHDIHLALLLIGLKPESIPAPKDAPPPDAIDSAYLQSAPKLKGEPVRLSVKWTLNGKTKEAQVEDWILNLQTNKPATPGPWTYNGSMIENGVFLADEELSIAAVITDPTALVNNPREGYDNDQIWQVRDSEVPALDTPVEITITLADSAQP